MGVQGQLLQKIISLATQIRIKLTEVGLSNQEVVAFFAVKIFRCRVEKASVQNANQVLKRQVLGLIGKAKEAGFPVESLLREVLSQLQIENGFIEEYEDYIPEPLPILSLPSRKSSSSQFSEPPRLLKQGSTSIWQGLDDAQPVSSKMPQRLNQLMSFQRQLNQSLKKTKMLKNIIHKRLIEEMEDTYTSRIKHIHELLALEGSC